MKIKFHVSDWIWVRVGDEVGTEGGEGVKMRRVEVERAGSAGRTGGREGERSPALTQEGEPDDGQKGGGQVGGHGTTLHLLGTDPGPPQCAFSLSTSTRALRKAA